MFLFVGNHTCFVCKKADSCTKRCSVATCGKFYHEECISKIPNTRMETRGIICPLHICATCAAENAKNPKAKQGTCFFLSMLITENVKVLNFTA